MVVGATGFEPVTSSVSAKCKEPLCGRSFLQVAPDRRGRSYMLSQRSVKCSSDALRASLTPRCPSRPPHNAVPLHRHLLAHMHLSMLPEHFYQHCLTPLTPHSLAFLLSHCPPLVPSNSKLRVSVRGRGV